MSGIYIPGMEMPTKCADCEIASDDCVCPFVGLRVYTGKLSVCPLVPVPDHGDLVDRAEMREIAISLLDNAVTDQEANAIREMWSHLGQMPVFIPADEEGET